MSNGFMDCWVGVTVPSTAPERCESPIGVTEEGMVVTPVANDVLGFFDEVGAPCGMAGDEEWE
jgi:hypothetical protein